MTGSHLYSLYCAEIKYHWNRSASMAIFTAPANPPEPRAFTFLTDTEQKAWDTLAKVLEVLEVFDVFE